MRKTIILSLVIVLSILLVGCNNSSSGLKYTKIEADHLITSDDISSYITISSKKVNGDMYYSLVIYSDFLRGTSRYYNYYQVDYETESKIEQYYHNFVFEDANKRKYAQRFLPFQKLDEIKKIDVLFSYEYKNLEEEVKDELKYHEKILNFSTSITNVTNNENAFNFTVDEVSLDEGYGYKVNLDFDCFNSGHIDFQTWIVDEKEELVPFFGVYHYQVERGNYRSISYEELSDRISKIYLQLVYHPVNEEKKVYILEYDI